MLITVMKRLLGITTLFILLVAPFLLFNGPLASHKVDAATVTSGPIGSNNLRVYPGPGKGEATLEWQRVSPQGENYSILYGNSSKKYIYQARYVGYVATYTVRDLKPGNRYFFALQRIWTGDSYQPLEGEVSVVAPSAPVTVAGTAGPIGRNGLTAKSGPKAGQISLTWNKVFEDTQGYSIVYGTTPGKYVYGAVNAVTVNSSTDTHFSFTVGSLKSGQKYYLALIPNRSSFGGGIYTTAEVSATAR